MSRSMIMSWARGIADRYKCSLNDVYRVFLTHVYADMIDERYARYQLLLKGHTGFNSMGTGELIGHIVTVCRKHCLDSTNVGYFVSFERLLSDGGFNVTGVLRRRVC